MDPATKDTLENVHSLSEFQEKLAEIELPSHLELSEHSSQESNYTQLTPFICLSLLKENPELWENPEGISSKLYKQKRKGNDFYIDFKSITKPATPRDVLATQLTEFVHSFTSDDYGLN